MFSRKKKRQYKYINGTKGVISLLLCLLLTPFFSIALGLVEYHRYQSVIEITDELLELVGVSSLANYDPYIHNRFGLLSVSQESDLGENADYYADTAASSLGKQIDLENVSITGELALSDPRVLKQQLYDFSELTVTSAILMEDFNIEELVNALNMVERFQTIISAVQTLADLADKLTVAVEAGETLKTKLQELQNAIRNAESTGKQLAQQITDLYEKLANAGIYIPENATIEQITQITTSVAQSSQDEIKEIVGTAKDLLSYLKSIKTKADECYTAAEAFVNAVNAAKDVVVSDGGNQNNANISQDAKTTLDQVLDSLVIASEQVMAELEEDTINTMKQAVDDIIDAGLESMGISDLVSRYNAIISGTYFSLPLSEQARNDLSTLLSLMPSVWNEGDADRILDELEEMFVPKISFRPSVLLENISLILAEAAESIATNAITEALELLTKLINTLKKLFDLDVFYEADLNAFVNVASGSDNNPYQTFLEGIGLLFGAVQDFSDSVSDPNIIGKLVGTLGAVRDLFKAIGKVLTGIVTSAAQTITNVVDIAADLMSGNVEDLYKRMLVAGYMRHNLPSRTNSGGYGSEFINGAVTGWTQLSGSGLTGFAYDKIARPVDIYGQTGSNSGEEELTAFQKLANTLDNLRAGAGQDKMFKGAELEYIRAGTNSELANQIFVFFDIYFLRLLLNAPTVFGDSEVAGLAAAATIASWAVYLIYMLAEPFCDTILLVNGAEVSFIKNKCYLTIGGFTEFVNALGEATMDEVLRNEIKNAASDMKDANAGNEAGSQNTESFTSNLTKVDYGTNVLLVLLINVSEDTMIERLGDIIDLETTEYYKQQGMTFSMEETYTTISVSADVSFNSFFDLGIASGDSPLELSGTMTRDMGY